MRNARKYSKKVQIFQGNKVPNTFGGNTVAYTLITESWCELRTIGTNRSLSERLANLGVIDISLAIVLRLRKRPDIEYNGINQLIRFRNEFYIIQEVNNVNYFDEEIEIIAIRQRKEFVDSLTIITERTFDSTFDLTFK